MWLNSTMHFGLRGRQEHTNMLWGDMSLHMDDSGNEFIEFNERITKTRQGNSRDVRLVKPRMYAIGMTIKITLILHNSKLLMDCYGSRTKVLVLEHIHCPTMQYKN